MLVGIQAAARWQSTSPAVRRVVNFIYFHKTLIQSIIRLANLAAQSSMDNDAQDGFRGAAAPAGIVPPVRVFPVWRSGLSCTNMAVTVTQPGRLLGATTQHVAALAYTSRSTPAAAARLSPGDRRPVPGKELPGGSVVWQQRSACKQDPPIGTPSRMDNDAQDGFRGAAAPAGIVPPVRVFRVRRSGLSCTEHGRHGDEDTGHARKR